MKDAVVFSWFTSAPKLAAVRRWVEAALATRVPSLENGLTGLGAIRNGSASLNGDFLVALDFARLPQVIDCRPASDLGIASCYLSAVGWGFASYSR